MKKKILPNIAQKLPILDIINPMAEIINKIQPIKLIVLLLIFFFQLFNLGQELEYNFYLIF
jgi:hypothetical protein